jgi:hypothetical protein
LKNLCSDYIVSFEYPSTKTNRKFRALIPFHKTAFKASFDKYLNNRKPTANQTIGDLNKLKFSSHPKIGEALTAHDESSIKLEKEILLKLIW